MGYPESISSISNSTGSMGSSISASNLNGFASNDNSISCFDGGCGGGLGGWGGLRGWGGIGGFNGGCEGCGSSNTNIINLDIDIGRSHRRCC
ncbi:hypothetical protein DDB_G0293326 [Dictyostelium discoideum AX4]|uniref:UPF0512 protein M n=1 Tax=Dictyostelium discoideum TaxID=44689 RepID=U512M_DICDI|nr:hypothetical protein DDB_G0293326 [Dictyostelium discoideum AX4]Q54BZ0.1 RecName: Full=UPF0512 protein M [Dictyostelium discoideum]EAL60787.1 hypothetical protein DDB_G0293326 [Dictyostelium discoideum AX4]|eukprot:XP_629201.1 hypothetical protein DDB_G0293326 [Dictyostelium discoideum AX4]